VNEFLFLPGWPLQTGAIVWFGLLLLAATVAGELASRWLRLPRIIGYVAAGLALGPPGAGLIGAEELEGLRIFLDIAIGLVLFELGQRIDLGWLRRNPWLLGTSLLESALAFTAVFVVLWLLKTDPLLASAAAAIGVATSPAVVTTVAKELRAQGQVTERLLLLSALNTVYAFLAVTMLFSWLHLEYRGGWLAVLLHPLYLIVGSLLLAFLAAAATVWLLQALRRSDETQFILVVAMVVLAVTIAANAKLSVAIALLAFGVFTRLLDRQRKFVSLSFGRGGLLFVVMLFCLTGAGLDLKLLLAPATVFTALALIAARFAGKAAAVFALAAPSALGMRKASLLSMGLLPMAGLAVVMVQDTSALYPEFGARLAAVILAVVAILEVLGPLAAHFALRRAGEAKED
jgi:Kef-type K+ transport system membrane component KefB